LKLKFIADADLNEHLIRTLRGANPGIDFLTASEGGTRGLSDRQIIELAVAANRVIVSHDRSTMTSEFYRFIGQGHSSPGLIIVDQEAEYAIAIENFRILCEASTDSDLRDQVNWVPISRPFSLRVRLAASIRA
jgi:hypothetical protein